MEKEEIKYLKIIRLTARILGAFLLFVVLLFIFGEGFQNPADLTQRELLLFIALVFMVVGLIISFKYELPGGVVTVLGYIFFAIVNKRIISGPVFPLFFVVGALYIIYCLKSGKAT